MSNQVYSNNENKYYASTSPNTYNLPLIQSVPAGDTVPLVLSPFNIKDQFTEFTINDNGEMICNSKGIYSLAIILNMTAGASDDIIPSLELIYNDELILSKSLFKCVEQTSNCRTIDRFMTLSTIVFLNIGDNVKISITNEHNTEFFTITPLTTYMLSQRII